jgi:hypothetical protein
MKFDFNNDQSSGENSIIPQTCKIEKIILYICSITLKILVEKE